MRLCELSTSTSTMLTVLYWTQVYQYVHTKIGNRRVRLHVHTRKHMDKYMYYLHSYHFVSLNHS